MIDISRPLLAWYEQNARPLPWRENISPYRVWVSEIMLQQTRIEAARSYFERFIAAFPTVEALAAADEETVLKLWEGLGYYSRARNLHKCAKMLVSEYGGVFPCHAAALRRLPGIGEYTAGAIASLAYGEKEPAVDGNVLRVLARLKASPECVAEVGVKKVWSAELREIYPSGRCGDFTSAIMELGETVCVPGTPHCELCPLASLCLAHERGEEMRYPVLPGKKPRRIERRRVLILRCGNKIALRKRPDTGLLARLWELPNDTETTPPAHGTPCGEAIHVFSHVEWHMTGYIVNCEKETPGYVWVSREEREALAIPAAFRYYIKVLEDLGL